MLGGISVPRYGMIFVLLSFSVVLAACTASPEEQVVKGLANAQEAFEAEPESTTDTVGPRSLYLPNGFGVEEPSDGFAGLITKGSDSFSLLINPNEGAASTFFYDLQKVDAEKLWVADETFQQNGRFGFATIEELAENQLELVVSAGGVKLTTVTTESEIPKNMDWMMKTVRSIDNDE